MHALTIISSASGTFSRQLFLAGAWSVLHARIADILASVSARLAKSSSVVQSESDQEIPFHSVNSPAIIIFCCILQGIPVILLLGYGPRDARCRFRPSRSLFTRLHQQNRSNQTGTPVDGWECLFASFLWFQSPLMGASSQARLSNATVSQWKLCGKRSTGWSFAASNVSRSSKRAMSRARVAGSQET